MEAKTRLAKIEPPKIAHDPALGETQPLSGESFPDQGGGSCQWLRPPDELLDHPRYEILEFLGAGGMGVVYKARHRLMQRDVALKVINRQLLDRPDVVERFRREVRAAARLTHPNIVHAYDADQCGASHFLIMEFVEGVDLEVVLLREGKLSLERAACYARQTALGLEHANQRGMIHRDIKPHNLMLTPAGQIKILDFGLARLVDVIATVEPELAPNVSPWIATSDAADITGIETQMGTADYVAPEVIADPRQADIRSDIYSLGCTLYRMLSGKLPCVGASAAEKLQCHREGTLLPLEQSCPDLPAALLEIVQRMLAKDPASRYQTPREAAAALARFDERNAFHILVVDDDPMVQQVARKTLGEQGYLVSCASNGQEALDQLQTGQRPSLILLDLSMPVMDGLQFLQRQKQDDRLADIPVMVISSSDAVQSGAMAAGADDALRKPMHVAELAAKVAAWQSASAPTPDHAPYHGFC